MIRTLSLRARISLLLSLMAVVVLSSGAGMFVYTYRSDSILREIIRKDFFLYRTTKVMEYALANQKGFLTYYLVDGDEKWLESLALYRTMFEESLEKAVSLSLSSDQNNNLSHIERTYKTYTETKDIVIEKYKNNEERDRAALLHEKQRDTFFNVLEMCRTFSNQQWEIIQGKEDLSIRYSATLRIIAFGTVGIFMVLGCLLLFVLYHQVLGPIRGLAIKTGGLPTENSRDEVDSLSRSLKEIMKDFDETHDELAKSRKHLLQVERMAMVGELAAGVAHTIRNPFTSIKMRMFSLTRSLDLTAVQHEDLKVISDEIGRIDRIVQSFLEFARFPRIKLETCSMSTIISSVIVLLEYRLKEYEVKLTYHPRPDLPDVMVDVDRIKEALVNLITNACEAMGSGGEVSLSERLEKHPALGDMVVVTVSDSGPGIDESILHKLTTPFFTTKEDGSGLGLSIVDRVVKEHKGELIISSAPGQGSEFLIKLPVGGGVYGIDSDH